MARVTSPSPGLSLSGVGLTVPVPALLVAVLLSTLHVGAPLSNPGTDGLCSPFFRPSALATVSDRPLDCDWRMGPAENHVDEFSVLPLRWLGCDTDL